MLQLLEVDIQLPSSHPQAWDGLVVDCIRCVGPIRQMLQERGVTDQPVLEASHMGCAAALLTHLWRDVRLDVFNEERVYIPGDIAAHHGLDLPLMVKAVKLDSDRGCEGDQGAGSCDCASMPRSGMLAVSKPYCATMRELVERTDRMFLESRTLWPSLPAGLRRGYRRMTYEGRAMLGGIAWQGYDTLTRRPALGPFTRAWIDLRLRLAR